MTKDLPTAAQLTEALQSTGVLPQGHVQTVTVDRERATILSRLIRLRLTYDHPAPEGPATIMLKTGLGKTMDPAWPGGRNEVAFYHQVAPSLPPKVVPRCFGAQHDPVTGAWHILLEDVTDTHLIATEWPLPPSRSQCQTILTARARFHAAWWDDPRLGVSIGTWFDAGGITERQRFLSRGYAALADRLGDNLSASRRDLYERFMDAFPRLLGRYQTHRDISIIQGDSHVWNCFLPRDGGDDVRLFDWDAWRPHVPALDLAYMMAMHWYPDRRQRMERPLLDHYHTALLQNGVTGYDRQMLDDDYRWSVLLHLTTPILHHSFGIPPVVWWNNLERNMLAVDDLGCREFLV